MKEEDVYARVAKKNKKRDRRRSIIIGLLVFLLIMYIGYIFHGGLHHLYIFPGIRTKY